MDWFERLTGFAEVSPAQVRDKLRVEGSRLISSVNQRQWRCGELSLPRLDELRSLEWYQVAGSKLHVREQVADVQALHAQPDNAGALFQVASQFNLLEMVSPNVSPERGVGIYERDFTQGPACAIAAGAGTIYRNYFVEVEGQIGQNSAQQLDCLADLGAALGNEGGQFWQMKNGYVLVTEQGLREIGEILSQVSEEDRERLKGQLRIGVQADTEVMLAGCEHRVTQAFCSALPIAYAQHPIALWEEFARLVLEAAYEATLAVAMRNARTTGNPRLYLTLLGGGAFGNPEAWILQALRRALLRYQAASLEVVVVSYGRSNRQLSAMLDDVMQNIYPDTDGLPSAPS